jgi:RecA/RadA recombinase
MSADQQTAIDPLYFEKLLIKWLFMSTEVRERVLPFLSPAVFNLHEAKELVKKCMQFKEKYGTFPSVQEALMESSSDKVQTLINECVRLDEDNVSHQHALDKVEEFFRGSLLFNSLIEAQMCLKDGDWDKMGIIPDRVREAISFTFNSNVGLDFFSEEMEDRLYESLHDNLNAISTGVKSVDDLIDGGFHEKTTTLFLAQVNLGKTAIMVACAVNAMLHNKNVLYVTLEISENKISHRVLSNVLDADRDSLRLLTRPAFKTMIGTARARVKQKFIIKEYPTKTLSSNGIRNLLKELKVKQNFVPDIIFVDYISLLLPNVVRKEDNSYTEMKRISEELRGVAVEAEVPIVTAEQIGRDGFDSAVIGMANVANSIGTVATADIVIAVTQPEELRNQKRMVWMMTKNRFGFNNTKAIVGVDFAKMRVFDITDGVKEQETQQRIQQDIEQAAPVVTDILRNRKRRELSAVGITFDE